MTNEERIANMREDVTAARHGPSICVSHDEIDRFADAFEAECTKATNQKLAIDALNAENESLLLSVARAEASRSVLMQAMAAAARGGRQTWAKQWIEAADDKAAGAKLSDFVTAKLNSEEGKAND